MALEFAVIKELEPKYHSGLMDKNHLGYMYGNEPVKASKLATKLFQMYTNTEDLYDYIERIAPTKYYETDEELYWDVTIGSRRNIPLIKCRINGTDAAATDKIGVGGSVFELIFPESYFFKKNVIFGDHWQYQIRILEEPENIENNYVYKCKYIASNLDDYIPYSELTPGKRFSKLYTGVESTMSLPGGGLNFDSPFRLKNYFTTLYMEDIVPGGMQRRPMALQATDEKTGKTFSFWNDYREFVFDMEFRRERAHALYYSKLNVDSTGKALEKGTSGFSLVQGAGLRQQLEGSGIDYYPTEDFDIEWMTSILLDLSVNRLSSDQRKFVFRTGERGMVQFSKSLERYSSLYTPLTVDKRVDLTGNNILRYKGQFLEFMGPQGITVTLAHDPFKDSVEHNKILHPNGGPAESYTYDILDIGTSNGDPNIFKVGVKGMEDVRAYELGIASPWNLAGNNIISSPQHSWKEYRMWQGGIIVKDPTRCKIMKPQILSI